MTYEDAIECDDLTLNEVKHELKRHGASLLEFLEEVGVKEHYTGEEVLGWLGY